jgi:hypothetical protein
MKVSEQIYEFEKLVDTISPGFKVENKFDTDIILLALNIAQMRFIKERYLSGALSDNIILISSKQDELRKLIVSNELLSLVQLNTGILATIGYEVDLTQLGNTFMYYLRSATLLDHAVPPATTSARWFTNIIADDYGLVDKVLTTPYNKPILRQPIVAFKATDKLNIVVDSYSTVETTNGFSIDYLRQPKYLGITDTTTTTTECELIDYLHEEITKLAVDIYIKEYKFLLAQKDNK